MEQHGKSLAPQCIDALISAGEVKRALGIAWRSASRNSDGPREAMHTAGG